MGREGVCDLEEHSKKYRRLKPDRNGPKCVLEHS